VNGVVPRLFDASEASWLHSASRDSPPDELLHTLLLAGKRRSRRESVQAEAIERLARELPLPRTILPQLVVSELKRRQIEELSRCFD
jgi:hypothetical protein